MFKNALFIVCAILCLGLASCGDVVKYDRGTQLQVDVDSIARFLANNPSLTFEKDRTGLHSQVINPGGGDYVVEDGDDVVVTYTGKLLSGIIVERADTVRLKYSGLIEGWRVGLKKIKPGGTVRLLIPSTIAYTDRQVGAIPPNSNLDYTINVKSIWRKNVQLPNTAPGDAPDDPDDDPATNDGGGVTLDPDYE